MQLTQAPFTKLVELLKELSPDRKIGFDYKRDPKTSTKAALLSHLIGQWTNEQIIQAWNRLESSTDSTREQSGSEQESDAAREAREHKAAEKKCASDEYAAAKAFYEQESSKGISISESAKAQKESPTVYIDEVIEVKANPHTENSDAAELAKILARMTSKPAQAPLDAASVRAIIDPVLAETVETVTAMIADLKAPTRVVVAYKNADNTETTQDMGIQHKAFPTLLKAVSATLPDGHRLNIWLKGPAGSGKTTAAHNAAKALNLAFHFNGAIDTKFELTGFVDAGGRYHRTAFREAFEHGGVYLFDEVDSSNPSAVLAFNSALANGVFTFPDGQISRHADCCVIAGANTAGNGANSEYVGRFKQDAAFLDRFVLLEWELDEALESAIATDMKWTQYVQAMRSKVKKRELKNFMITPRASLYGSALLRAGLSHTDVELLTLRKGLNSDAWDSLSPKYASSKQSNEIPF